MTYAPSASQQSDTTAITPVPFSPFSSAFSIGSEETGTSEEPGDLGAFSTIFRALTQLHPRQPFNSLGILRGEELASDVVTETDDTPAEVELRSSDSTTSLSDSDEPSRNLVVMPIQFNPASDMWKQGDLDSYLTTSSRSDLEETIEGNEPTLGALASALIFLAKERARLKSKLDESLSTAETDAGIALSSQRSRPRKGRRERRLIQQSRIRDVEAAMDGDESRAETVGEEERSSNDSLDLDDIESSLNKIPNPSTSNITPIFRQSTKSKPSRAGHKGGSSSQSSSFQSSVIVVPTPESVALKDHLTSLAKRLSPQFPADAKVLSTMTFDTDRLVAGAADFNLSNRVEMEGFYESKDAAAAAGYGGKSNKGLVHVFVDHSNILVGFLEWLKKQPQQSSSLSIPGGTWTTPSRKSTKPKLSHASLILLLERGRPCGRRVLVASSPLHQGVDDIIEMGYEVSVLQRVAIKEGLSNVNGGSNGKSRWAPGHSRNNSSMSQSSFISGTGNTGNPVQQFNNNSPLAQHSSGGSSTESGRGKETMVQENNTKKSNGNGASIRAALGHRRYGSAPGAFSSTLTTGQSPGQSSPHSRPSTSTVTQPYQSPFDSGSPGDSPNAGNITHSTQTTIRGAARYREEAVDELLQLKLLQVLVASTDRPPRGSTIILATGDGASSQFNKDGFLGCVRQAVDRGWRVELVAWEEGRSRAWGELAYEMRRKRGNAEKGKGFGGGGLHLVSLERWGWDLLDPSCH